MDDSRRFQNILYDLSQDLVNEGIVSLSHHALLTCISGFLKSATIVQDFISLLNLDEKDLDPEDKDLNPEDKDLNPEDKDLNPEDKDLNPEDKDLNPEDKDLNPEDKDLNPEYKECNDFYDIYYKIEKEIYNKMEIQFGSSLNQLILHETIALVVERVHLFLRKMMFTSSKDLQFFFNNLVITSQGTINTKRTVLKVIELEELPKMKKFNWSVKFFLDDLVYKHYNDLSEFQKSLVEYSIDIEKDYPTYFWMWRIKHFRKVIDKTYILSKDGKKFMEAHCDNDEDAIYYLFEEAINNHNDMAVQYLWTKFISNMNSRKFLLLPFFVKHMRSDTHTNILTYLLLQVKKSDNEINTYIKNNMDEILRFLIFEPRFIKIRNKIIEVLDDSKLAKKVETLSLTC